MKFNKFEISIGACVLIAWIHLIFGFTEHAFFALGILIIICLMGIIEYLRMILGVK